MSNGSKLLVDDDREMVDSFSRWSERKGYETKPNDHPMQSLMMATERKYDVAVIEIGLPDMNGLELLGEPVQLEMFLVIELSGEASSKFQAEALALGAFDYLVKPLKMEELEAVIAKALSRPLQHNDRNTTTTVVSIN